MKKGVLFGVGVGPGDPELLTLKAIRVLKAADAVVVPRKEQEMESMALAVAREHLRSGCRVLPLVFPMTRDKRLLEKSWEDAAAVVRRHLDEGETLVFLTMGDPMLYSTFIYLFKKLGKEGYSVFVVPGVPSFCAAASAAGFPLGEGEEKIAIIPWPEKEPPSPETLSEFATLVILKPAGEKERLMGFLEEAGFLAKSLLVSRCGFPEERIEKGISAFSGEKFPYFSLILARREVKGE